MTASSESTTRPTTTTPSSTTAAASSSSSSTSTSSRQQRQPEEEETSPALLALQRTTQQFRSGNEIVRIITRRYASGSQFIAWTDIKQCFPGVVRIQYDELYIPFMRDENHYRLKPHGIQFFPNVILDVIYGPPKQKIRPAPITQRYRQHVEQLRQQQQQQQQQDGTLTQLTPVLQQQEQQQPSQHQKAGSQSKSKAQGHQLLPQQPLVQAHIPSQSSSRTSSRTLQPEQQPLPPLQPQPQPQPQANQLEQQLEHPVQQQHGEQSQQLEPQQETQLADEDHAFLKTMHDLTADIRLRLSTASAAMIATAASFEEAARQGGGAHRSSESTLRSHQHPTNITSIKHVDNNDKDSIKLMTSAPPTSAPPPPPSMLTVASEPKNTVEVFNSDSKGILDILTNNNKAQSQEEISIVGTSDIRSDNTTQSLEPSTQVGGDVEDGQKNSSSSTANDAGPETLSDITTNEPLADPIETAKDQLENDKQMGHTSSHTEGSSVTHEITQQPAPLAVNGEADGWSTNLISSDADGPQPPLLTVAQVVAERMREVLLKRIEWIDNKTPKLWVLLPITHHDAFRDFQANGDDASFEAMTYQDFRIHFLCDCGQIPGFEHEMFPHLDSFEYDLQSYAIAQTVEMDNPLYGEFMMGVLEMFKYGVTLDNVVHVPKLELDPEMSEMIDCAINFLVYRGIQSSLHIYSTLNVFNTNTTPAELLKEIKPIRMLTDKEMENFWRGCLVDARPPLGPLRPFQTKDGDTRRVCWSHWDLMSPKGASVMIQQFSVESTSGRNYFDPHVGSLRGFLKTREQAKLYFRVAAALPMVPALSFYLDWEMTVADEAVVEKFVRETSAKCVKIYFQEGQPPHTSLKPSAPGMGHGHVDLIQAGLTNPSLQAFSIENRSPTNHRYMLDELVDFTDRMEPNMGPNYHVAHMRRDTSIDKMYLSLLCTDVDRAACWARQVFHGFDALAKLTLQIDSIWEKVCFTFSANAAVPDILDPSEVTTDIRTLERLDRTGALTSDLCKILAQRGYVDEIKLSTVYLQDSVLLRSGCLRELSIGHSSSQADVNKIREMLRSNYKKLESLDLTTSASEDPCQIFETFKAPLANCPKLVKFEIRQTHPEPGSSTFCWRGLATGDRSQLTLEVSTYAGDKVGPLFQKMASCLVRLSINGMEPAESAVLEKVLRLKKGPFKLRMLNLWGVNRFSEQTQEDLKKIVTRYSGLDYLSVSFDADPKVSTHSTARAADFLLAVASKITSFSIYGKGTRQIIDELDKRMVRYLEGSKSVGKNGGGGGGGHGGRGGKGGNNNSSNGISNGNSNIDSDIPIVPFPLLNQLTYSADEKDPAGVVTFTGDKPIWLRTLMRHRFGKLRQLHLTHVEIPESVWPELLVDTISFEILSDIRLQITNAMSTKTLDLIADTLIRDSKVRKTFTLAIEELGGLTPHHIAWCKARIEKHFRQFASSQSGGVPLVMINHYL
ncbi:hypothetical protein BGZ94_009839 [Podila epigama]|nr:hypothetical protein BGZ94_009839 [Podila epigama]